MLAKSLQSPADSICYDLEDSVSPIAKSLAREQLVSHLNAIHKAKGEIMVRINAIGTGHETSDLEAILSTKNIQAIALPKTESRDHVLWVKSMIERYAEVDKRPGGKRGIKLIGMIENARGMMRIREIAESGKGCLDGLVVSQYGFIWYEADIEGKESLRRKTVSRERGLVNNCRADLR